MQTMPFVPVVCSNVAAQRSREFLALFYRGVGRLTNTEKTISPALAICQSQNGIDAE
jgi:hypothetical protein